ncbi:hypothetical protein EMCRGX_G013371 [Ephydatia muelleri]
MLVAQCRRSPYCGGASSPTKSSEGFEVSIQNPLLPPPSAAIIPTTALWRRTVPRPRGLRSSFTSTQDRLKIRNSQQIFGKIYMSSRHD